MSIQRDDMNPSESRYWRSLRELYDERSVTEQRAHEFMSGVTDDFKLSDLSTMSRKQFLALLTASASFAAVGCSGYRDKGEIVPYTRKPEEVTPGVANYYASTCTGCQQACGVLVKTREGRPVKIDGNPDHPLNRGALCAKGEASILGLYDPSRLRAPVRGSSSGRLDSLSWRQVDSEIRRHLEECVTASRQIALITHQMFSPSAQGVLDHFAAKYPTTRIYTYDLFNNAPRRRAWQRCYGSATLPVIAWERAKVILALESDFLGTEGSTVEQIRKFAAGRDIVKTDSLSRLYCVEGALSLTGTNADYRIRLRPDLQAEFLLVLLKEVASAEEYRLLGGVAGHYAHGESLEGFAQRHDIPVHVMRILVRDLLSHRGQAIVHAGETLTEGVHILCNYLNEVLGNTALYDGEEYSIGGELSSAADFTALVRDMKDGKVGAVIHFGTNPVFHLPREFEYREGLRAVPVSISLVETEDETAQWCSHVLPVHNAYESWGDFSTRSGMFSLQQPVVSPLYATRQKEAVLLTWASADGLFKETLYHEYVMHRWEREVYPEAGASTDFATYWHSALHDGVVTVPTAKSTRQSFSSQALTGLVVPRFSDAFALQLRRNHFLADGRFANNGWLQELPHPVSRVVWDNYAALSPETAKEMGVTTSDMIAVTVAGLRQVLPVFVQPGQADRFVSVELGYGRSNAGPIGTGVGTNANTLLPGSGLTGGRVWPDLKVVKVPGRYNLVSTQEHHALDDAFVRDFHLKRKIIREGTLEGYRTDPQFLQHDRPELFSISTQVEYKGLKWAMAIDLNRCVGCGTCVSGCNVENNIPVVGKEQVEKGREMQWIRVDRYYAGTPDAPRASHQPMVCQHCDQAPCENVCPVVATNHSPDGLNQMAYNRCVGTKYCSNNCPYKVRRFNFFNFRDHLADGYYEQEPVTLMHNPDVTVRSRGVMEKCTFCIQRIAEARQHATEKGKSLRGSEVKTACQEACPAQAIVFGDMNDPDSEISRYRKHALGYYVLEETNVRPNVTYIARLRNIHSEKAT